MASNIFFTWGGRWYCGSLVGWSLESGDAGCFALRFALRFAWGAISYQYSLASGWGDLGTPWACNILPADAQTLEVTCETFPVLADVKTASLLATQRALEAAAAASPSKRPATSAFSWARKLILWSHDLADADAATARSAYLDALTRHTAALDKEHPDLTQVRAALQQRLEEMSTALSSGAGPGGQGAGQRGR